jgi:hypothetical protein
MGGKRRLPTLAMAVLMGAALGPGATTAQQAEAQSPEELFAIARQHLIDNAAAYGVTPADVTDLVVTSQYESSHNGIAHVNVQQRRLGVPVNNAHGTVNIRVSTGEVVFVGENFTANLVPAPSGEVELAAVEAVEAAADALDLGEPANLQVLERDPGATRPTVVSDGGISHEPISMSLGWQPTSKGLRLAWQATIDSSSEDQLLNAIVDAETGDLLAVDDWTIDERIEDLAVTLSRREAQTHIDPADGPFPPSRVNDGSSYNVFQFPKNDPNDGPRTIVSNPADGLASPYGWHDLDGVAGPDSLITLGNNVEAYSDRDNNNAIDPGSQPNGGAGLDLDFPADYLNEHPQTYVPASVTNLYYWCNIVHDVMYRYGFNELGGNFQVNNYGRGGNGGDDVRCEAQDGSGENNANFSTPAGDGGRPRMQMFLWPGNQFGLPNLVTVGGNEYTASYARHTPAPTSAGLTAPIELVSDGSGTTSDGCQAFTITAGAIALMDNSATCNHTVRVTNAQNAGASAVVVAHNTASQPTVLSGSVNPPPTIPMVGISQAAGTEIKAALPTTAKVSRNTNRVPMRDAAFRTETIFHEYGHGVSLRLTGGPMVNCLNGDEQAGEGWSDFFAINTLLDPNIDDPEQMRGYGSFALYADTRVSVGFRAAPYSRNMAINPFTYDSIKTNGWLADADGDPTSLALPHGLGHGWAAILWDLTWNLVEKYGYHNNPYSAWTAGGNNRAMQYVIDGLKFQGCNPTLLRGRDAIISAANVLAGGSMGELKGDSCTIWATFARRGFGFSAVAGTTNRNDNEEAFDTHPGCRRGFSAPPTSTYGALTDVTAGDVRVLRFTADGYKGLDVLATHSPYSRLVDCATLRTVHPNTATITPRPLPVDTVTPGNSKLSVSSNGVFTYPWLTDASWANTCRELVLTRDDGVQHRAFFRFLPPEG